jgi:hypothetical protein
MTQLEKLYGVKKATWKHLPYMEAFILKNRLADDVLTEINKQPYMKRDDGRKIEVLNAIKFNEERMRE